MCHCVVALHREGNKSVECQGQDNNFLAVCSVVVVDASFSMVTGGLWKLEILGITNKAMKLGTGLTS